MAILYVSLWSYIRDLCRLVYDVSNITTLCHSSADIILIIHSRHHRRRRHRHHHFYHFHYHQSSIININIIIIITTIIITSSSSFSLLLSALYPNLSQPLKNPWLSPRKRLVSMTMVWGRGRGRGNEVYIDQKKSINKRMNRGEETLAKKREENREGSKEKRS